MAETAIEWASDVWNPTTGCDRVSPGCDNCYALTMAKRLKGMGQAKYQNDGDPRTSGPGFGLTVHEEALDLPLRWRKPSKIFVNSMSDLFHADVPDEFIARVFAVMARTPHHTYQVLTKRHGRMRALIGDNFGGGQNLLENLADEREAEALYAAWWPLPNVHLGVSAEDQKWAEIRIPALLETAAEVRWVSAEPLLGPIDLTPYLKADERLGWVVVGGESGPGARPCEPDWIRSIVGQCRDADVPVFVKQMGSVWASDWSVGGKTVTSLGDRKGGDMQYWPEDLRVREFPQPAEVADVR